MTTEQLRQNAAAMLALADGKKIEWFDGHGWVSCTTVNSWHPHRPKPEPVTVPWSMPEHVPLNCWIQPGDGSENMVVSVAPNGIKYAYMEGDGTCVIVFKRWDELQRHGYSTDRLTWKPCTVTQ